ncbi:MAG TPA: carboxypeptidase-like regulatory domain-containing protein, partial [Gemmatales bacterium]|nr:carboxypeptidase-like regulatory domain-containing protein [Gemmatales bacterium]
MLNDDGVSSTDKLTTDPTIRGDITDDDGIESRIIELDWNNDGIADGTVSTDVNGEFEFTPDGLEAGQNKIQAWALEWDPLTNKYIKGNVRILDFTLEVPVNHPPEMVQITLKNDTGTPGDLITSDPTILGQISDDEGDLEGHQVEIDWNQDGVADGATTTDELGQFSFFPAGLRPGQYTIAARVADEITENGTFQFSTWKQLHFTLVFIPNTPANVTVLQLKNDTETANDGITTDPTLVGTITHADGPVAYMGIQFDYNSDDEEDGFTYANHEGNFEFKPYGLNPGLQTIRARAIEWDAQSGDSVVGPWKTISFTLQIDPLMNSPEPGAPVTANNAVMTLAASVANAQIGSSATSGYYGTSIASYNGAMFNRGGSVASYATPLVIQPGSNPLSAASVSDTLNSNTSGSTGTGTYSISFNGNLSYSVTTQANGNFSHQYSISYSFSSLEAGSLPQSGTYTLSQTGTYSLTISITGIESYLSMTGSYTVDEDLAYTFSRTETRPYDLSIPNDMLAGAVTIANTGVSGYSYSDDGSFTSNGSEYFLEGDYSLVQSYQGSYTYSDAAVYEYEYDDLPYSYNYAEGEVTFTYVETSTYLYSEEGDHITSSGVKSVSGDVMLSYSDSTTVSLDNEGLFLYENGLNSGGGTFEHHGQITYNMGSFQFDGTFSSDSSGAEQVDGDYEYTTAITLNVSYVEIGNKFYEAGSDTDSQNYHFTTTLTSNQQVTDSGDYHYDGGATTFSGNYTFSSTTSYLNRYDILAGSYHFETYKYSPSLNR